MGLIEPSFQPLKFFHTALHSGTESELRPVEMDNGPPSMVEGEKDPGAIGDEADVVDIGVNGEEILSEDHRLISLLMGPATPAAMQIPCSP
jgi:hypothetical protein